MLAAIESAQQSVDLEMYTYGPGPLGERFREALTAARRRGLRVRVLLDAIGTRGLPSAFWRPLQSQGGEVRYFNPLSLHRFGIRDHRKLLVCDSQTADLISLPNIGRTNIGRMGISGAWVRAPGGPWGSWGSMVGGPWWGSMGWGSMVVTSGFSGGPWAHSAFRAPPHP